MNISPQLTELVELYLDAAISLPDQLEILELIEGQLRRQDKESGGGENVIPLRRSVQTLEKALTPHLRRRPRQSFAVSSLLEGTDPAELKKLAVEIHDLSHRYAFLYLEDLSWSDESDLLSLGPVTLFVPELEALSVAQQTALAAYLRRQPGSGSAQVVAATTRPFAQLKSEQIIHDELMQTLCRCYLKMDRPFADYHRDGVLHFFFGSLTRNEQIDQLL